MRNFTEEIEKLFAAVPHQSIDRIEKIPQSGGDRAYFRVFDQVGKSYIATQGTNLKENRTFLYFSHQLKKAGAPVPEILAESSDGEWYLQEDVGSVSLLDVLEKEGFTERVFKLFQKSLHELAHLQIKGDQLLDYNQCLTSKEFGQQAILSDLLYFKYYFLDTLKIPYDKEQLLLDFEALSNYLAHTGQPYFMYRDFQSRNIMVKNDEVHFIDYQGGMKGALQYDVASLLWQAKANLTEEWKELLLRHYMDEVEHISGQPLNRNAFISQYNGYVLIRLLQVLGAYGFRGLFERKAHFLSSIPLALNNLKSFLDKHQTGIELALFDKILKQVVSDETLRAFQITKANEKTALTVKIKSFSYLKNGYPASESNNGGGFVFDCRGILNPGRIDEYKKLSGLDKPVKDFLDQQTLMPKFLNSIYDMVDIAVEDYIKRGFDSLEINFGCTGGQHRSVFAAEAVNRHLKNKFGVKTVLQHINKENWVK